MNEARKTPSPSTRGKHDDGQNRLAPPMLQLPLTPIKSDLASHSTTLSVLPEGQIVDFEGNTGFGGASAMRNRSGSMVAVIMPEKTAWRRSVYLAGPIRLPTVHVEPLYSMSTLDQVRDSVEIPDSPWTPGPYDDFMISEITSFVESYGFEHVGIETEHGWAPPAPNDRNSVLSFGDRRQSSMLSHSSLFPSVSQDPSQSRSLSLYSTGSRSTATSQIQSKSNRRKRSSVVQQKSGIRRLLASATSTV